MKDKLIAQVGVEAANSPWEREQSFQSHCPMERVGWNSLKWGGKVGQSKQREQLCEGLEEGRRVQGMDVSVW